ncbi:MAG: ABC transporter substrate-binding protein [Chloroflexi bacterium]|nr:ABC transporter substrate-binding protein [Chloroflexota bacterium]
MDGSSQFSVRRMGRRSLLKLLALASAATSVGILQACAGAPAPEPTKAPAPAQPAAAQPTKAPAVVPTAAPTAAARPPAAPTPAPTAAGPIAAPTVSPAGQAKRGGTIRVATKPDFTVFDPAHSDDYQSWTMAFQIFDGLYYFDKDGKLQEGIADGMPKISPDGLTYTIKLKKGVKFHNGREVEAADFKYSWERILNPKEKAFGNRFIRLVEGGQEILDGKSMDLKGVKIPDKYTLELHLSQVSASFLYNLGTSYLMVVPREEVEKLGEDFGRKPVGTGAYKLQEWKLGQIGVFVRNESYFKKGLPNIDRIEYHLGIDPQLALLKLERGEVDFLLDGVPMAEFASITTDPKWKPYLTSSEQYNVSGLYLNVTWPPFDNIKVRTAVGLALDRKRIVQLLQGFATLANGWLPPTLPGARTDRPPFEYNLDKAKALLKEAGHADGFAVEFPYTGSTITDKVVPAIQADLAKVGIKLDLKQVSTATGYAMRSSDKGVPMGVGGKGSNTPDLYDWMANPTCETERISSITRNCMQELDALVFEAEKLPNNPEKRRELMLKAEDLLLASQARHLIYYPKLWAMHTPALKGFYANPIIRWWWQDYWLDR